MDITLTPERHLLYGNERTELYTPFRAEAPPDAGVGYHFFRRLTRDAVARACRSGELANLRPSPETLEGALFERPPMEGGEYLDAETLEQLLTVFADRIEAEHAASGIGAAEFLRQLNPAWENVGRVCFHLADNKKNEDGRHPFAFLATFIHHLSENDEPRHLPLGAALKTFADDRAALLGLLKPVQKAAEKSPLLARMLEDGTIYRPGVWTPAEAFAFVREIPNFEEAGILIRFANLWKKRPPKLQAQISLDVEKKKSRLYSGILLKFTIRAIAGGEVLTDEELAKLLDSGGGLLRIKGQWVEADPANVTKLLRQWGQLPRETLTLTEGMRLLAGSAAEFPGHDSDLLRAEAVGELENLLDNPDAFALPPLPAHLAGILRPYQKAGVAFLCRATRLGMGACLADDMGLGKTLQVLTFLAILKQQGAFVEAPALLILPASLLGNWQAEAAKFAPELKVRILHGASASAPVTGADLVVTTYATLTRLPALAKIDFAAVIADEAQAIKNPNSIQSRAVRSLRSNRRIALTGTPVENRLTDLWSIFDFLSPGLLGNLGAFLEQAKGFAERNDYTPLRKLTAPYILRRLKSDRSIIRDLPDKTEVNAFCLLTRQQTALYLAALDAMKRDLAAVEEERKSGVILGYLMHFKQICNHPAQYLGGGHYAPEESGKFLRLAELAESIAARQEKVLIFTQFRELCEPLHEHLAQVFGRPGLILHGGTPVKRRAALVEEFQREGGPPFFVLSLKAAGTGLNLTAASHVIHFDRWWNPAVENQATDRAYRIGQHRNVLVHKFLCAGTIEERIDALIRDKRDLADTLLASGAESNLMKLTPAELLDFARLDLKNSI